jgi:hypothetical protein
MEAHELVGKSYVFPDGNSISVFQVKERDGLELFVTYHIQNGPGIPRKHVLSMNEFMDYYGHLFQDPVITDDT